MISEFIREPYNSTSLPFLLVSNEDHFTLVEDVDLTLYYISKNGGPFVVGTGRITSIGRGCQKLVLGRNEQDCSTRLISIQGQPDIGGYDPVSLRILGSTAIEVAPVSQRMINLMTFLMVAEADHVTPMTGLTPEVMITRDGSDFESAGTAVEIGRGFYGVPVPTLAQDPVSDFNNECVYLIKATAHDADPSFDSCQVFRYNYPA